MAKRLKTKIGDIFSIAINEEEKRYMQLITFDLLQLNSDVIRIFEKRYFHGETPEIDSLVNDKILTYAHCSTDLGLKLGLWDIVGNSEKVGDIDDIIFRGTSDYARKEGDKPVTMSDKWYIWRIGDNDFTNVGKLKDENRGAYIGLVINPLGIVELAKENQYPPNYPDFE